MSLLGAPLYITALQHSVSVGCTLTSNPAPGQSQGGTAAGTALKEKGLKMPQFGDLQNKK